jgi:DNA-binding IclR family transcriptional regulator
MTKAIYSAPALEKGLDILEMLSRQQEPLSLTRLAAELGRSKSEIFRMMMVLLERGYVARDPDSDTLTLTDRLFTLGLRTPRARDLVSATMPVMNALAEATNHSLHLVVVYQGQTVVLGAASGGSEISFRLKLGFHRPSLDATSGKVILAFQSDTMQDVMIREGLPHLAPGADSAALRADLARIRHAGFDHQESRHFVGLVDLCCPVLNGEGFAAASIIMACLRRKGEEDALMAHLPALQTACREAAQQAGIA